MRIGEVCLMTNNVPRLAGFYARLLGIDLPSIDPFHQFLIAEETMLAVCHDGAVHPGGSRSICLAFTVEDVHQACLLAESLGAEIVQRPTRQSWGATNMCLLDPDGNMVYLRQLG